MSPETEFSVLSGIMRSAKIVGKEEKPRKTSNYNAADYGYGRWEDFPLYQEHVPSQISFALETIRNGADGVKTERPVAVDEVAKDGALLTAHCILSDWSHC